METFSVLLALCAGNSPVTGEFPSQRPVTRSFDVFFDLRSNKRMSKQSWGWWFETPSRSLWRHCNDRSLFTATTFVPSDQVSAPSTTNALTDHGTGTCISFPNDCTTPVYFRKWRLQRHLSHFTNIMAIVNMGSSVSEAAYHSNQVLFATYLDTTDRLVLKNCEVTWESLSSRKRTLRCPCMGSECDLYLYYSDFEKHGQMEICEIQFF